MASKRGRLPSFSLPPKVISTLTKKDCSGRLAHATIRAKATVGPEISETGRISGQITRLTAVCSVALTAEQAFGS